MSSIWSPAHLQPCTRRTVWQVEVTRRKVAPTTQQPPHLLSAWTGLQFPLAGIRQHLLVWFSSVSENLVVFWKILVWCVIFSMFFPTFFLNFRFRALPLCQTGPCSTNGSTPIPSQASLSAGSTSGPTLETAGAELRCCGAELRCSNINTQKKMHFPRPRFCLDGSQVHPSIHLCSLLGANERLAPKSVNGSLGEGASDPSSQKPILIGFFFEFSVQSISFMSNRSMFVLYSWSHFQQANTKMCRTSKDHFRGKPRSRKRSLSRQTLFDSPGGAGALDLFSVFFWIFPGRGFAWTGLRCILPYIYAHF